MTPNNILLGLVVVLPTDQEMTSEDDREVFRKQQKYMLKCKEAAGRFHRKYLAALRERHNLNHKGKLANIQIGDKVIIKGESKTTGGHWKLANAEKVCSGKGNVIGAVGLQTAKNYLE